ncbi:Cytochrome P450, E-class, group I,Cytochrome P450,Cytochrome P450, conserved site [Cinara cedri]|uniref:Cytochrome P450, E-class, group I,Cytochrome P450,Cytochrome P450, conserved site n=1 Tax=Cinara cedri TaxID=506608 RepID=A0A5E4NG38_9HEMI|nr:Cytochrome P450, E-class, group I,Cytochrome P450,Cytochrome P450, conserved site [Cinara cedri]
MFSYFPSWCLNIVVPVLIVFLITYYFCTLTFNKWEKLNVPYIKPIPLFGNFLTVALGIVHPVDFYRSIYYKLAGNKYGGIFQMRTPYLMIRDPGIINNVLIKDFSYFPDRGIYSDFSVNPLSNNLFFMNNPQWKVIRNKLSPAFTSGKLKLMYNQIKECGDELMKTIRNNLAENHNNEMEVRDVMGKYSTEVIGSCAFGLKLNAISDEKSAFRKYGKNLFRPSLRILLRELSLMISPVFLKIVKLKDFPAEAGEFFHSAFHETITYREKNNIVRNDFVQILMQARRDLVLNQNLPPNDKFTETQIVANAFVMFAAGFETVSTAMSFCLYELALKKHIQDRLREEIKSKMSKNNGVIDSEFLIDLNYLDMVLAETLRKYPPTFALFRKASQDYCVPNDSLIIEKGQKIIIPIYSLHYDAKYFPDPEIFDPHRFSPEEKSKRQSGTYLPFGDGPRICIGKRFAELEMKLALVEILSKFEVEPCEKTEIPIKFSKQALIVMPENGIWLKFKQICS